MKPSTLLLFFHLLHPFLLTRADVPEEATRILETKTIPSICSIPNARNESTVISQCHTSDPLNTTFFVERSSFTNITKIENEIKTKRSRVRFCNVGDEDEETQNKTVKVRRYVLHGDKWKKKELTWTLRTPSRKRDVIDEGTTRQQLSQAMNIWERETNLNFREVHKDDSNVDIYIDFVEGKHHGCMYPFDGPGNTLAHAFYPAGGIGGDMHFDDSEGFAPHDRAKELLKASLLVTAVHELGHSLGLRHSDADDAMMAPFYQDFPLVFDLPSDDRYAIQALYGTPQNQIPSTTTQKPFRPPTTPYRPVWPPTTPYRPIWPPTTPFRPPTRPPRPPTRRPRPPTRRPRPPTRPTRPPTRPPSPPTRPPRPTHPPTRPPRPPRPSPNGTCPAAPRSPSRPDICLTTVDAATRYRKEIYFFKDVYYFRVNKMGKTYRRESPGYIKEGFPGLPGSVRTIDAVYVDRDDALIFFSGTKYYKIVNRNLMVESGQLADLGVNATKLDAAMIWGHNGRVYLFSGDRYWRLGRSGHVEPDYPRDIAVWRGLPPGYSAVLTIRSATYFFAGRVFWGFDSLRMKLRQPASLISPFWLNCPFYIQRELVLCSSVSPVFLSYPLCIISTLLHKIAMYL